MRSSDQKSLGGKWLEECAAAEGLDAEIYFVMSISGYFDRVTPRVSMPKSEPNAPDALGISCSGRVLNGRASLLEAVQVPTAGRCSGDLYRGLDPMLRDHICKK
jgi:hypothetical protein